MSNYAGNDEECEHCQLTYGRFRTGFSYQDIWLMFWTPADADPSEWKRKTRGVILGKWFEIKQTMWNEHQERCSDQSAHERELTQ